MPLTMIPHKTKIYRANLVLLFALLVIGHLLPSVDNATKVQVLEEAMDKIESVLPQIIKALADAPMDGDVVMGKMDISDGFVRMV